MNDHGDKLSDLNSRHVFLELGDERLDARAHGRQQIVGVHHNVNSAVNDTADGRVATVSVPQSRPHCDWQDTVVHDVQSRHLARFLAQDKEHRVQHVDKFRQPKEIT